MKITIKEFIKRELPTLIDDVIELNQAIEEAKGISSEVEEVVKELNDFFQEEIDNTPKNYLKNDFWEKNFSYTAEVFGKDVNFNVKVYYFKNINSYNNNRDKTNYLYKYVPSSNTVYISIYVIGDKIIKNTFNSKLAHEIKHYHQYIKTGYNQLHSTKYYDILKNIDSKNPYERTISNIVYLSSDYEQQAYTEELYNELMYSEAPYSSIIYSTNTYKAYESLKKSIAQAEKYSTDSNFINALKQYGYNFDDFIRKANFAKRNFIKKIGRTITQYQEDDASQSEIYVDYTKQN